MTVHPNARRFDDTASDHPMFGVAKTLSLAADAARGRRSVELDQGQLVAAIDAERDQPPRQLQVRFSAERTGIEPFGVCPLQVAQRPCPG
jgi:hypothetical protein